MADANDAQTQRQVEGLVGSLLLPSMSASDTTTRYTCRSGMGCWSKGASRMLNKLFAVKMRFVCPQLHGRGLLLARGPPAQPSRARTSPCYCAGQIVARQAAVAWQRRAVALLAAGTLTRTMASLAPFRALFHAI